MYKKSQAQLDAPLRDAIWRDGLWASHKFRYEHLHLCNIHFWVRGESGNMGPFTQPYFYYFAIGGKELFHQNIRSLFLNQCGLEKLLTGKMTLVFLESPNMSPFKNRVLMWLVYT